MKLIRADYIFLAGLLFMLITHTTTNFLIGHCKDVAKEIEAAEETALMFEAAPVARWILGIENFTLIFSFVVFPAILIGFYYLFRRSYHKDEILLEVFAITIFSMFFINALNDVSLALGIFL